MEEQSNTEAAIAIDRTLAQHIAAVAKKVGEAEVAEACGVKEGTLRAWMYGKRRPKFEALLTIAELGDYTVDQMLGRGSRPDRPVSTDAMLYFRAVIQAMHRSDLSPQQWARFGRELGNIEAAVLEAFFEAEGGQANGR